MAKAVLADAAKPLAAARQATRPVVSPLRTAYAKKGPIPVGRPKAPTLANVRLALTPAAEAA